uniref:Retrotransposon protein, putative, Ty3-gypsy sub-class n=2 Tax=Oryza sativa subsp. japonica TaxID=39947 RepID=Q2R561_ORYSJ|nr:retrotransposon protein, putative, Ty3-gypsy sub-class [Oryza sativa Japonica Group]ABA93327.1 retrotransposon protein, putative, Ty3-gypsy subclass [Oryza sativa Japonica Group]
MPKDIEMHILDIKIILKISVPIRQPRLHHQRLRQDFSPRLGFNQSGRDQISAPFGIPNSAEVYPKIISTELASNLLDKIQSTSTRPDQDDGAYPPILMKLPDDLAAIFTTRASSPHRPRRVPASAPARPSSREVGVILQPLGTVSTEQLDGYLSSPGVDSQPTEIMEYDDFGYRYDYRNLDDFDEVFEDNYTPLYFGIFMADNETEEQPITLLDTLLKEDALNQANHIVNILNQTKTMIAASVPVNSASVRTPTGSRVPHLRSQDYHQPSLSVADRYDDDVDGVAAFTSDLRQVDWLAGFKPTRIEKYDGTTNPESWLTVYGLAIRAAGGDSKAMANYLPVALVDSARSWLHGLPRGTIGSWAELRDHFIANFQSTFERPGAQFDLYNVIQKSGESLRDYIRRFSEQCNKISDISDDVIIAAFTKGIRHEDLVGKFGRKPPKTVKQMFKKATSMPKPKMSLPRPSSRAPLRSRRKIRRLQGGVELPITRIASFAEQYAKNTRKTSDGDQSTSKKKDDEDDASTSFQDHRKELNHIFRGPLAYESKRKQKLTEWEINAVQPDTPRYLRWSETTIKFDRSDHPDRLVHPRRYPLVLDPVVRKVKLRRSLIDGGSALNILFAKTLDDMQIPCTELKPSNAPFHGVIPGLSAKPLGQITLPDRKDAIKEELTKLLAAGFIKEVLHPDWLANPVLVRKKTGQWRMCVDYTDLNKSCPKDSFGLPHIDQIGRNVEAYVDDVVVKTKQKDDLITDLEETFASIRAFRMKLNPEKCIFGVPSGKLLGSMVSHRGIQANPEKINAILNMKPPSSQKDVQKLTGCMAALSWKLSHYFQGHSVTVVTSFPLGDILHNREAKGRIAKWALELMSLDISFKPRTLINSQALADFVAEWTKCQEDTPAEKMEYQTMHFDGSKRLSGTGAGVVLISPTGERLRYVLCIHFSASHNVAEYEALLHGLRIAISLGIRRLIVCGDSQLVVNQVMKEWSCLDDNMTAYRQEVRKLEDKFDGLELTHVLRHNNEAADRLANFGSKREAAPSDVFVEHLYEPTVPRKETIEATDTQDISMIEADWREPLIRFLTKQELPQDKDEAKRISRRSRLYVIHETELYKRNPSGILQRYVSLEERRQLLKDIHSGICRNHAAARTIVGKAYRQAVDKFSKWIEAKTVITITADKARDFFINIVHRFGVPNRIITDNDTQFTGGVFKDFCEDFGIKICYASIAHPMSNGQVERANGMVLQGIKARVFDRLHPYAGKWVEQLPSVLWSLRTTPSRATGQSPFFLVYGAEAMLPSEV